MDSNHNTFRLMKFEVVVMNSDSKCFKNCINFFFKIAQIQLEQC